MNSGFLLLGRVQCESCAEKNAQGFGGQMPIEAFQSLLDPTICDRCGRDSGSLELPTLEGLPLCQDCGGSPEALPDDLQRVLGDVEQYVSLGFIEDAREALSELGDRYSDHPAFVRKLAELILSEGRIRPVEPPGTAQKAEPPRTSIGTDEAAQRLARLVVSEIKLYNPSWKPGGYHTDDERESMRRDIERGREYFNQRVSSEGRGSTDYYQEAVVSILGGGDPGIVDGMSGGSDHEGAGRADRVPHFRPCARDALTDLESHRAWPSQTAESLLTLVDELLGSGYIPEALHAVKNAVKTHPESIELRTRQRMVLAQRLKERGWHPEAIRLLEDATKDAPSDPQLLRRLADVYLMVDRVDDAEAVFRRLVQTNPHDAGATVLLDYVLKKRRNLR
jgi:tetratricopeptide (TPR) repeat protein